MRVKSFPCLYSPYSRVLFLNKQLALSMVAGYQAAIASAFKNTGLPGLGYDPALTALLTSFSRKRHQTPRVLPQWNLSLVLMALTRTPFEPLHMVAPKFLAWKVFFLTLLASGARKGELHATMARSIQHDNKWKSVSMSPHPGFISQDTIVLFRSWLSQPSSCA